MGLFSFYDREAIEFVQQLLAEMPEAPKKEDAAITNKFGLSIETHVNHF